jgi:hypothetical protein
MGKVNEPFMTPERMARNDPMRRLSFMLATRLISAAVRAGEGALVRSSSFTVNYTGAGDAGLIAQREFRRWGRRRWRAAFEWYARMCFMAAETDWRR